MMPPPSSRVSRIPLLHAYLAQLAEHPLRTKALTSGEYYRTVSFLSRVSVHLPQRDTLLPTGGARIPSSPRSRTATRQGCTNLFTFARACQGQYAHRKGCTIRFPRLGTSQPRSRRRTAEGFCRQDRTRREAQSDLSKQPDCLPHSDLLWVPFFFSIWNVGFHD